MARERELRVQIVGDASGAKRAFNDVEQAGDRTSGKFSKWGAAAAGLFGGAIAAGAGAAAVELVNLGAELEQMQAKAETVFGTALGQVQKWAKGNANAMGLTSRQATGLAANMGDLLVPMGFTREQAAQLSTDVLQLSGALSVWSGGTRSASEVAEILTSAMLGEMDALKGLGINLGAADVEARKAADGTDKLTGAEGKRADVLAIIAELMRQTTDAQAQFNDGVPSTGEKIATLKAKWAELKEELAVGFMGAAIGVTTWWDAEGQQFFADWRTELEETGGDLYDFYNDHLKGFVSEWDKAFRAMGGDMSDFSKEFDKGMTAMETDLREFGRMLADLYLNSRSFLGNVRDAIPGLNPTGGTPSSAEEWLDKYSPSRQMSPAGGGEFGAVTNVFVEGNVITEQQLADAINEANRTAERTVRLVDSGGRI